MLSTSTSRRRCVILCWQLVWHNDFVIRQILFLGLLGITFFSFFAVFVEVVVIIIVSVFFVIVVWVIAAAARRRLAIPT